MQGEGGAAQRQIENDAFLPILSWRKAFSASPYRLDQKYRKKRAKTMDFITRSPEQTERLGEQLAQRLRPGDVIAYLGDLGAGKTAFTRGLARGLGVRERVTSPTYTIVNEYLSGRLPLFHFDMYRLHSADDLFDIGWEDYLERGGVCAVEWSENVLPALEEPIWVRIEKDAQDASVRHVIITGGDQLADLGI